MPISTAVPCPDCGQSVKCEIELQLGSHTAEDGLSVDVSASRISTAPHTCKPKPRGADIEIYEPEAHDLGVIKPTYLRINGVDILTPEGCPAKVEGLVDPKNCATVTVTMFARSIKVYGGADALER